jgi:PASTA domain
LVIAYLRYTTVGHGPVVLEQSPDAGSVVRCNSTVTLTTV